MPQTQTPSAKTTPSTDAPLGAAEPRAFDTPAELLVDEIGAATAPNTIPEPQADGTAAFHDASKPGAKIPDLAPLKAAAEEFRATVTDVLKGQAGTARGLASDAYDQLRGKTTRSMTRADIMVRQRPYAALGAAVVFGMLFANLTRRRR